MHPLLPVAAVCCRYLCLPYSMLYRHCMCSMPVVESRGRGNATDRPRHCAPQLSKLSDDTPDAFALALALALALAQQPSRAALATPSRPPRLASPHWSISRVQAKLLPRPESPSPIGNRQILWDDGKPPQQGDGGKGGVVRPHQTESYRGLDLLGRRAGNASQGATGCWLAGSG